MTTTTSHTTHSTGDGALTCNADLPVVPVPPTPAAIDAVIAAYEDAKRLARVASVEEDEKKKELIDLVKSCGYPAPNAERSWRINGGLNTATVTTAVTVTVKESGVAKLKELLFGHGEGPLFFRLFSTREKHELAADSEEVLKTVSLPKRLLQKVQIAYGECISVKDKTPSVKVELLAKEPRVKKPRAKKGTVSNG
jgi:predicted lysophospholipase L1 biosynthesis ABC-type transport system permease subunit